MDKQCANTRDIRRLKRSQQGVADHACSNGFSCIALVNRQSGKNHDRDRLRHVALDVSRRKLMLYASNRQRIVSGNLTIF